MGLDIETRLLVGEGKKTSQDQLTVLTGDWGFLLGLADGAGGAGGGLEAALAVMACASRLVSEQQIPGKFLIQEALFSLDQMLYESRTAGTTTAVLVAGDADGVWGASVGDTRLWRIGGELDELTRYQRRRPFLGEGTATPVCFEADWSGETLLLASDGLAGVPVNQLAALTVGELSAAADSLVVAARVGDTLPDDLGLILARRLPGV